MALDNSLRLWNLGDGTARSFEGYSGWVTGALLRPDGGRALSWSYDSTLRLWDLASGRELKRFVGDIHFTTVVFSHEHQMLLVGDVRGRVMFFDLPDALR